MSWEVRFVKEQLFLLKTGVKKEIVEIVKMGWLLGESGSEILTKINILLHFNLIVTKIKMQQKSQFCWKNSQTLIFLAINPIVENNLRNS